MPKHRTFLYDLHGLIRVRLTTVDRGELAARSIDSKLAAFRAPDTAPVDGFPADAEIEMEIGPFEPEIPARALVIDKDFWCADDYVYFRGSRAGGATEILGLEAESLRIRHHPYAEAPWRRPARGLRGVNMYLEPLLKLRLAMRQPPVWLLHGGAVARDGRALLVCGANGAFKTQLILDLCHRHGFEFLGDDLILMRDGRVHPFVEHPGVLSARWDAVRRGRKPRASAWRIARNLLRSAAKVPANVPVAEPAVLCTAALIQRGSHSGSARVAPVAAADVWDHACRLEQLELSKHQRRHRQVTNFARLLMAYEYAFPGSPLFRRALIEPPAMPAWFAVPAWRCELPGRYDAAAADRLCAAWEDSRKRIDSRFPLRKCA